MANIEKRDLRKKTRLLPNELIEEILLRLPVKSIKRFQSVCPAWKTLILNPIFVKSYGERRKDLKKFMIHSNGYHVKYSCSLNCGEVVLEKDVQKFKHGLTNILSSCDGLILTGSVQTNPFRLCIWNPSTREIKELPVNKDISSSVSEYSYGFGSATSSGYTVLVIDGTRYGGNVVTLSKVVLYNTSTNSWRRMKGIPYTPSAGRGLLTLVKAKLYFYAEYLNSKRKKRVLLGFDIENEEFMEVLEPDYDGCSTIAELSGDLCIVSHNDDTRKSYVWVRKEDGTKESWANMFCIDLQTLEDITYLATCFHFQALLHYDEGKILLRASFNNVRQLDTVLFGYDCTSHRAKLYKLDGVCGYYSTTTYVETLISPNAL
ncbi:hypothetical protein ACHQM5_005225 [Ranunculus cassubicifolius]